MFKTFFFLMRVQSTFFYSSTRKHNFKKENVFKKSTLKQVFSEKEFRTRFRAK